MARIKVQYREGQPISVAFQCPGCGSNHDLPVRAAGGERPSWEFNGNADRPTLKPSILATTGPFHAEANTQYILGRLNAARRLVCHSFVTDGRIQFLSDCTHDLAGQTVELPEIAAP